MREPLRIASIYWTMHLGGDESRLLSFARALDRERYELVVVALNLPQATHDALHGPVLAQYREHGVEVVDLGLGYKATYRGPLHNAGDGLRLFLRLVRLLRERRIDIVDARMNYGILFGALAGRLARVKAVVSTEYQMSLFWDRPLVSALGQLAFSLSDVLVCDSRAKLEDLQQWLWRRHPRALVVPNGIFPPELRRSRAESRQALGLPAGPGIRVIGQIGRLIPYKGCDVLLDAAHQVLAEEPDVVFLLCGYGPWEPSARDYPDRLRARAQALGIADRVRIVGYPGPIGDVWPAIDLHVHASLLDSSPITIHESMAIGRPAVVTAVGGIPDLVEHERTGLVVPPGDSGALATALLRLLREPATAARLGAAARRRYEERHRPEIMTRTLCRLFDELAQRRAGPGRGR